MKTLCAIAILLLAPAGRSFADVSNEVVAGLEADSSKEVKNTAAGVETDITGAYKTAHSLLVVQYTRFFTPLSDDDTPIELRRFLQHPAAVGAALAVESETTNDDTNSLARQENTGNTTLLLFSGEYYFPTDTGLFLSLGGGSGTFEQKLNGMSRPNADASLGTWRFGVRQYAAPNVEFHLVFSGDSVKSKQDASETSTKKNIVLIGAQGAIRNTVGFLFEIGGGSRTDAQTGIPDKTFDVGAVNLAAALFIGQQLSFRLDIGATSAAQTGTGAGPAYSESEARVALTPNYWFSERFGLQVPLYTVTKETRTTLGPLETKRTETDGGIGVYAAYRF